jgi:hypothetical protein
MQEHPASQPGNSSASGDCFRRLFTIALSPLRRMGTTIVCRPVCPEPPNTAFRESRPEESISVDQRERVPPKNKPFELTSARQVRTILRPSNGALS